MQLMYVLFRLVKGKAESEMASRAMLHHVIKRLFPLLPEASLRDLSTVIH